ncbi:hypothetical protein MKY29_14340 [Psychrobacillus sp. FSL K6-2365]|uniref:hypothetical protein n=1 Tax=Psychrobacillus sp. FSL K6-2365 TaxID=2921546 RepID=UPI0030F76B38
MDVKKLIARSKEASLKSMDQLVEEKHEKYRQRQNELRKKWIPERYNTKLDEKK